jgi:hypothetical protein
MSPGPFELDKKKVQMVICAKKKSQGRSCCAMHVFRPVVEKRLQQVELVLSWLKLHPKDVSVG